MKRYIRFGEIPKNERSTNYFTKEYEKGVSVFDENLELTNLRLVSSLANRIGTKAYIVTGDEVGKGNDGEPLIINVKVIEEFKYNDLEISNHIYETMENKFKYHEGDRVSTSYYVGSFTEETKRCKACGKTVNWFENCCDNGYEKREIIKKYVFNEVDFIEPVEGFDCDLGYRK